MNGICYCRELIVVKAGRKPGSVHILLRDVGDHLSGTAVTGQPLAAHFLGTRQHGQPLFPRLAPSRGLPSQHLSMLLVRSYRTFAPLPCLLGFPH